jgi:formylglycine-generating enzyme required for sulfatase activity
MKNNPHNQFLHVILGMLSIGLVILACNSPFSKSQSASESTPTEKPANLTAGNTSTPDRSRTDEATEAPVVVEIPEPVLGDTIRWIDGSLLVYIPPGEFIMGHDGEDNPEHEVYLDGFWIYRTEVTNHMYLYCMAMGECSPPAIDPALPDMEDPELADHPVVGLTWYQAMEYCQFVDGYLPTEAQWEKTARGTNGWIYPWDDPLDDEELEPSCELLNFDDCEEETTPVREYSLGASPYDVFDMAGNVFEWVADWYEEDYYNQAPFDNPMGPEYGEDRSVRGSTFRSGPEQVETSLRYFLEPDEYRNDLGFRCIVGGAHEYAPPCEILAHSPTDGLGENPDEAPGGSASCIVQQPELAVVTYCDDTRRGYNISWTPADADIEYSSSGGITCVQYDADTLACMGYGGETVNIEACKACPPPVVQLGVLGTCDPPYVFENATSLCKYDGPPIPGVVTCAPGYSLSGDDSCCVREEGSPLDFPICPVGGVYEPTSQICWFTLPSTGDKKCASESILFEICPVEKVVPGGGDDQPIDLCAKYKNINDCLAHKDEGCDWSLDGNFCHSLD